jgi:hypothetical protein
MPDEPANAERRRDARPALRGALLWAVVGAALFVGVGVALPVWTVEFARPDVITTEYALDSPGPDGVGPLWTAVRASLSRQAWRASHGQPPLADSTDAETVAVFCGLVGGGAGIGFLVWLPDRRLRPKGGGA